MMRFGISRATVRLAFLLAMSMVTACTEAPFEELLDRGGASLAAGNLDAATIDVKAALQQQPKSARARQLMGEIYFFQQDMAAAAAEFERSLDEDFTTECARLLARALFRGGEYERLLDLHNERFFETVESDGVYLAVIARALGSVGEIDEARQFLKDAAAASPDATYVRFTVAEFKARADRDFIAAIEAVRDLLDSQPDFAPAWSLLGVLSLVEQRYADAREAFQNALEINAFRFSDRLNLATLLISTQDWEAARPHVAALIATAPTHPGATHLRARLSIYDGKFDQALQELNAVLGDAPRHAQSLYLAAVLNAQAGNYATASSQLVNYIQLQPEQVPARLLLGKVYLNDNRPADAELLARSVLEKNAKNTEASKLIGAALDMQSKYAESIEVYTEVLESEPENAEIHARLGAALTQAGEHDKAISTLRTAKSTWPQDLRIRVRLVQALLKADIGEDAANEANATLTAFPDSSIAHTLVGQTALFNGDKPGARASFERAIELDVDNRGARDALAGLALSENDIEFALNLFRDTLDSYPDDIHSLSRIADIQASQLDVAAELTTLQQAIAANPEALELQLRFARSALLANKATDAITVLRTARERHADDPRVHQLLAEGFLAMGEVDSARGASNKLIDLRPRDPEALLLASRVASAQGDYAASHNYLATALDLTGQPIFHAKLAENLMRQGRVREALNELSSLPPELLASEPVQMLQGTIRLRGGEFDRARQHFEAAYKASPTSRSAIALSAMQWQLEDRNAAIQQLEGWIDDNPEDGIALNQLASYYSDMGAVSKAAPIWERLLRLDTNNSIILNNLAWLYRKTDSRRALGYIDRALEIAPTSPNLLDTRALILLNAGRKEEALQWIDSALREANGSPLIQFHRALILAAMSRSDEARDIVEKLPASGSAEYQAELAQLRKSLGLEG